MKKLKRYLLPCALMALSPQVLDADWMFWFGPNDRSMFFNLAPNPCSTPLIVATIKNDITAAQELINNSETDCEYAIPTRKMTAFLFACMNGRTEIARMLLDAGKISDINYADIDGRTALHLAAESKTEETVLLLLGIPNIEINKLTTLGEKGKSPLHYAFFGATLSRSLEECLHQINISLILIRANAQNIGNFYMKPTNFVYDLQCVHDLHFAENHNTPGYISHITRNAAKSLAYALFLLNNATTAEELQKASQCLEITTYDFALVPWLANTGTLLREVIEERFIPKAATLSPELQEPYQALLYQLQELSLCMDAASRSLEKTSSSVTTKADHHNTAMVAKLEK